MKDLFPRHPNPATAGLWRYEGRTEDLTPVPQQRSIRDNDASPAERFLPYHTETVICRDERIQSAVSCATRNSKLAIVLDPAKSTDYGSWALEIHIAGLLSLSSF